MKPWDLCLLLDVVEPMLCHEWIQKLCRVVVEVPVIFFLKNSL